MSADGHDHYTANIPSSSDPSGTKTLRDRFSGEVTRRFRALRGVIRESIVDNDCFGLQRRDTLGSPEQGVALTANQKRHGMSPAGPGQFDFPRDDQKVEEFSDWLDRQVAAGIIEREPNPIPGHTSPTSRWVNSYIRPAYTKGVDHADYYAQQQGMVIERTTLDLIYRAPMHTDAAALIFSRSYRELTGITDAMDQQITRTLTNGLVQGHGTRKMAREINGTVNGVGRRRANMLARTEALRAYNEASLTRYEQMGVGKVGLEVEWRTAGDNRVCDECRIAANDGPYTIDDARGLLPLHPLCRCAWRPIV